jgi:hypothetical protein
LRYSAGTTSEWHKFPGLPKWNPDFVPVGLPELQTAITPDCRVGSRRGLNRSYNPRRDLSNAVSHSRFRCREGIDSRLLVVKTPGPSFAHNLGCRCPNCQCEGILDIYVSRPFQLLQEHPNARCFAPYCRALNIRESRRTPNPQLFQVLGFTPTLGQVRVVTHTQRGFFEIVIWGRLRMKSTCSLSVQIHKKLGNAFVWPCPSPTLALLLSSCRLRIQLLWPSLWHAANTRGQYVFHDLPFCLMDSLVPNKC